ncbi:MAG: HAMP domain-containing histidine kinase [Candidatus Omnitrophica bacterium]|nr:HAMP domain-containing histidine kinase [Candidatus Omnitrophota bacterium]
MAQADAGSAKMGKRPFRFHVIIFFVGMFFTVTLWDAYYNGSRPFDQEIASSLILAMGTLFSIAAGLFSWSLETRRASLEKEVEWRTRDLQETNKELAKKNQEVENFIQIISHDLKAPIVSIQGFTSILKSELGNSLQGTTLDYFNRIQTNAQHMNTLILDLLEFSRVGRMEDEKEAVDITSLLKNILEELRPEIDKRNIKVHLQDRLPHLWGSRRRLDQVFTNLISNAIKYMGSPQAPMIEIGFSSMKGDYAYTLWVKDNGIGIKKEFQEKIFQIFQRAPNPLKVEGTGIGLSIVKKIVALNGGRVWVESEEGMGSQFFMTWPKTEGGALKPESNLSVSQVAARNSSNEIFN